jgi:hypothetical protein
MFEMRSQNLDDYLVGEPGECRSVAWPSSLHLPCEPVDHPSRSLRVLEGIRKVDRQREDVDQKIASVTVQSNHTGKS